LLTRSSAITAAAITTINQRQSLLPERATINHLFFVIPLSLSKGNRHLLLQVPLLSGPKARHITAQAEGLGVLIMDMSRGL